MWTATNRRKGDLVHTQKKKASESRNFYLSRPADIREYLARIFVEQEGNKNEGNFQIAFTLGLIFGSRSSIEISFSAQFELGC
jgi:hypothetical protein